MTLALPKIHAHALAAMMTALAADAAFAVDVASEVLEAEQRRVEVVDGIVRPTICVFSLAGDNGGSGVIISKDGEALTNFHVVAGLGPFVKCGLSDGSIAWAVVVGIDPTGDLALIRLLGRDSWPAAEIGDSNTLVAGDRVWVVGNPFLLATNLYPSVSTGVVSGVGRYQYPAGTFLEYTECIQTDASINPGNSGGPMFDAEGKLVGINGRASFEKRGRVYTGAGYAISINQAINFLDHLRSGRIVDHGTLGATVSTDRASGRVYVQQVTPNSGAAFAGLEEADELIRFGGRAITSANDFKNRLGVYPALWRVPMTFRNEDGETTKAAPRLLPLHTQAELIEQANAQPFAPPKPAERKEEGEGEPQEANASPADRSELPEEFAKLYEPRTGFKNHYFNTVELDRVRAGLSDWDIGGGSWRIEGAAGEGRTVQVAVNDRGAAIKGAGLTSQINADDAAADLPPGTGGLLVALEHLRHYVGDPDAYFTDQVYLGSEPLGGDGPRVDVVRTRRGETVDLWLHSKDDGRLIGFETQINPDTAPCVVTFGPYADFDGRTFPSSLTVGHLGKPVLELSVTTVTARD